MISKLLDEGETYSQLQNSLQHFSITIVFEVYIHVGIISHRKK